MADDLNQFAKDLSRAPAEAWPYIAQAVEVTSRRIKDDWNRNLGGRSNSGSAFRHVGRSVDYDIGGRGNVVARAFGLASGIEAEIGPSLGRMQGAMAGWFEEGMRNIPALHPGQAALKSNESDFEDGLGRAIADGLRDAIGGA